MKTVNPILAAGALSLISALDATAQNNSVRELDVINQLSTQTAVSALPVTSFLNAPGNEKLKEFFLTPVKDTTALKGKRIAVLVADGFEEIELTGPVWYFRALGAQVDIVSPKFVAPPARYGLSVPEMAKTHVMAIQYLNPVGWIKVDRRTDEIKVDEYDAAFIPGGAWLPDNLRYDKDTIRFLKDFNQSGKLIAAICHGPLVLASADLLKGKKLTGYWNIQSDLTNAGGTVLEEPVVVDGNIVTSRHPIDVADFSVAVKNWLIAR